jgi:DNA modification methylase
MSKMNKAFNLSSEKGNRLQHDSIHRWYRFVLAFPDHLVVELLNRFEVSPGQRVLDPFCGTGTTLVECKKKGIESFGVDSNPIAVFASQVKASWQVSPEDLAQAARALRSGLGKESRQSFSVLYLFQGSHPLVNPEEMEAKLRRTRPILAYFRESGMIERGWVQERALLQALLIRETIEHLSIANQELKNLLLLALVACLVEDIADIKFGPELYCVKPKPQLDVWGDYFRKVNEIREDLESIDQRTAHTPCRVVQGDARELKGIWEQNHYPLIDAVITSPPYPTEHDYTRNTRLELAFLGMVSDRKSLQQIKRKMIRSHSKGIYSSDRDGELIREIPPIMEVVEELRAKSSKKTYGFAKMYPRIIEEYFGGMLVHFQSLSKILKPGAKCAYVAGEQRCYLNTYTPTASLLGILAEKAGFAVEDILTWRSRTGTTGSGQKIKEEILFLKKPLRRTKKR